MLATGTGQLPGCFLFSGSEVRLFVNKILIRNSFYNLFLDSHNGGFLYINRLDVEPGPVVAVVCLDLLGCECSVVDFGDILLPVSGY